MQLAANMTQLVYLYDTARGVVERSKCIKCWATEFSFRAFGHNTQIYTYEEHGDNEKLWAFDVERARALVGLRIDAQIDERVLAEAMGDWEIGHDLCLLRRADRGLLPEPGAAGIVAIIDTGDGSPTDVLIDGTHRGKLCRAAGVPLTVAILTAEECAQVVMCKPPMTLQNIGAKEFERMESLFKKMNADFFFTEMVAILGAAKVREVLNLGE